MSFRFIHTADWHLGRAFFHIDLLADQEALLDQLFEHVRAHAPDALIIAGDVFDRANPRREAVDLFDRFLARVYRRTRAAIVVIAGNHDAPERIGYGGALHDPERVLIRGPVGRSAHPLILRTDGGAVAISALPYAGIFAAREQFASSEEEIKTPQDVILAQLAEARSARDAALNEAGIDAATRDRVPWIVVAHAFVAGGASSESERPIVAGGIESVSPEVFVEATYVALGHLHRPQSVGGDRIAYPGSLMSYGFDEAGREHTVSLVEIDPDEGAQAAIATTRLAIEPPRPLRIVKGSFGEIMQRHKTEQMTDLVRFLLTDQLPVPNAMARLRERYPNAVSLEWTKRTTQVSTTTAGRVRDAARDPVAFVGEFITEVTGEAFDDRMREVIASCAESAEGED